MRRLIALALALAVLLPGCAVVPTVQWQNSTFEGFPVISYVPEHPKGMLYVFHGTNGSAAFAERVETTDVYIHGDLTIKERAIARTAPPGTRPGRYKPPDPLLAFLEGL